MAEVSFQWCIIRFHHVPQKQQNQHMRLESRILEKEIRIEKRGKACTEANTTGDTSLKLLKYLFALTWVQWKYLFSMIIFQTSALNVIIHEECLYAGYSNITKQDLRYNWQNSVCKGASGTLCLIFLGYILLILLGVKKNSTLLTYIYYKQNTR